MSYKSPASITEALKQKRSPYGIFAGEEDLALFTIAAEAIVLGQMNAMLVAGAFANNSPYRSHFEKYQPQSLLNYRLLEACQMVRAKALSAGFTGNTTLMFPVTNGVHAQLLTVVVSHEGRVVGAAISDSMSDQPTVTVVQKAIDKVNDNKKVKVRVVPRTPAHTQTTGYTCMDHALKRMLAVQGITNAITTANDDVSLRTAVVAEIAKRTGLAAKVASYQHIVRQLAAVPTINAEELPQAYYSLIEEEARLRHIQDQFNQHYRGAGLLAFDHAYAAYLARGKDEMSAFELAMKDALLNKFDSEIKEFFINLTTGSPASACAMEARVLDEPVAGCEVDVPFVPPVPR
ncbi:MAG: hypothetical protein A3E87_04740 [Gammaproteobacteria bacterium RIFCSPHIGHO2_12_FULL_35_23]|nr:MAG: hypothetical protein A3E87_04740 [Gammaproteobacteria bacterium RIFCSPHIGHO2_12_FULL_35_23]